MNEDVKLLLEGLRFCHNHELCDGCPLETKCMDRESDFDIVGASAEQIEALAAEIEVVIAKLETTTRERDAAVADLNDAIEHGEGIAYCNYCKHNEEDGVCYQPCNPYGGEPGWEWRGLPKEDS